ncbi:MAG: DUF6531 domain-containing protein, partial [Coriobacteriia bacterium]|nr:DUF6531 domain-containing protein [Coriobacteriia bacterium]
MGSSMDFKLSIPALSSGINSLTGVIKTQKEGHQKFTTANTGLTSAGTGWEGKGAASFAQKNTLWANDDAQFVNNMIGIQGALKDVLSYAKTADKQALSCAGIFGGSTSGSKGQLSYSASAKDSICKLCKTVSNTYDEYAADLRGLSNLTTSLISLSSTGVNLKTKQNIAGDIKSIQSQISANKSKFSRLSSTINNYASTIKALAKSMQGAMGKINRPPTWKAYGTAFANTWAGLTGADASKLGQLNNLSNLLASALGVSYYARYAAEPVNMATGNFIYQKTCLESAGPLSLALRLFYNAQNTDVGALGVGWVHNFEMSVHTEGNMVTVVFEDGKHESFLKGDQDIYCPCQGQASTLKAYGKEFVYQTHEGIRYFFNGNKKLTAIKDLNDNFIKLSYDDEGGLFDAVTNTGVSLSFYYQKDKLVRVLDSTGRQVEFDYTDGSLTELFDERGERYSYAYDSSDKIIKVTDPLGADTVTNDYDEFLRVIRQVLPDGGVISCDYDDEAKTLLLTEQNGNKITYVHDDKYRTTKTVYCDGAETTGYNDKNLITSHTDKRGNTTSYSYDNQGNQTCITNPLGEVIAATFSELNRPTEVKLQDQVIYTATYDERGNALETSDALGQVTKTTYDHLGQPIQVTLPDLSEKLLTYDDHGNITSLVEAGHTTRYDYDGAKRVQTTTDGAGNKTSYTRNTAGDIICVTNAAGFNRHYDYDALGRVIRITDFNGGILTRVFNSMGWMESSTDAEGNTTSYGYDLTGNVTSHTDAAGNTTLFEYDLLGRRTKVIDATGATTAQYTYDPCGNKTAIIGPLGEETRLAYDALNRVTEVTEPDGAQTRYKYNERSQITCATNALGQKHTFVYDAAGQLVSETDPAGAVFTYSYTPLGKIAKVTDPAGRTISYHYLPGGLLAKVNYPDGTFEGYTYDSAGCLATKTDQSGYELHYAYDCLNQIITISSNHGQETHYTYDAAGNVTSVTDALGNTSRYVYSLTSKLLSATDPLGASTAYAYDATGELIEVRRLAPLAQAQALNEQDVRITCYGRDAVGRVTSTTDPLRQTETYAYDPAGNMISKLDKEGFLTKYAYNNLTGQLVQTDYADGKSVTLGYDALRRLTQVKDWLGITDIELDAAGRPIKVTGPDSKEVSYAYGPAGERRKITYPDGTAVTYDYDEALRLKELEAGDARINYSWNSDGQLSRKLFSNGLSTDYHYNTTGLLAELIHTDAEGILDRYSYGYDALLNKTSVERFRRDMPEASGSFQYSYDPLGHLTEVVKDGQMQKAFTYDPFGNRTSLAQGDEHTDYSYNALDQLMRLQNFQQTQDFCYDKRGNLTQVSQGSELLREFSYNGAGYLSQVSKATGASASYTYNGLGQRTEEQIQDSLEPAKHVSYLYDLTRPYNNVVQTQDSARTVSYAFDDGVAMQMSDTDDCFYLTDELGSPLRFTGSEGSLTDSYLYDEFGTDLTGNQGDMQPFGYTGYRYDDISDTYFAQARSYDPAAGRFTSADPLRSGTNYYSYARSNPLLYRDLTG